MEIRTVVSLTTLLFITAIACQKDKAPDNYTTDHVKSYIETIEWAGGLAADTFNVNYDNQDRISSLVPASDPSDRSEYVYENDRYYLDNYSGGSLSTRDTYYLNSSHTLVDSSITNTMLSSKRTKYIYDANKQLMEERTYWANRNGGPTTFDTVRYTYNTDGLIVKEVKGLTETIHTYDPVIRNNVNILPPYMPVKKQLPTQTVSSHNGTVVATVNYTYTFDSDNRLV